MLEVSFFAQLCQLYLTDQLVEAQNFRLACCFQLLVSKEKPRVVRLLVSTWSKSCWSQEYLLIPSLLLSKRIVNTDSPLLRTRGANLQNDLFGTRVLCSSNLRWSEWMFYLPRLNALILLNTWWPVPLNLLHHFVGCTNPLPFLSARRTSTPLLLLPTLDKKMSNVLARISLRNTWLFQHSQFPSFVIHSMSLNIDMKMIGSLKSSGWMFLFSKSRWNCWRIDNDENAGKLVHSHSIACPLIPTASW